MSKTLDPSLDQSAYMTTFTGRRFTIFDPKVEDVDIEDIAQALSMLCRFTGHTSHFYSVAQHSVLVAKHLPPHLQKQGLLHDAQEAYVNDLSRPIKHHPSMQPYRDLEARVERIVREAFDLPEEFDPEVKRIDDKIVCDEAVAFMRPVPTWALQNPRLWISIEPWTPAEAKDAFLGAFTSIYG